MGLRAAQERARDRHSPKRLGHGGPTHIGRVNATASWPHNRGRKGISQSHLQRASSAPAGTERTCCPPRRRGLLNCSLHLVCGVSLWGPRRTLPRSKRRGSWLSPGPPPPLSSSTEKGIMPRSPGQSSSTCSWWVLSNYNKCPPAFIPPRPSIKDPRPRRVGRGSPEGACIAEVRRTRRDPRLSVLRTLDASCPTA